VRLRRRLIIMRGLGRDGFARALDFLLHALARV
jgi:hypothetical protein